MDRYCFGQMDIDAGSTAPTRVVVAMDSSNTGSIASSAMETDSAPAAIAAPAISESVLIGLEPSSAGTKSTGTATASNTGSDAMAISETAAPPLSIATAAESVSTTAPAAGDLGSQPVPVSSPGSIGSPSPSPPPTAGAAVTAVAPTGNGKSKSKSKKKQIRRRTSDAAAAAGSGGGGATPTGSSGPVESPTAALAAGEVPSPIRRYTSSTTVVRVICTLLRCDFSRSDVPSFVCVCVCLCVLW